MKVYWHILLGFVFCDILSLPCMTPLVVSRCRFAEKLALKYFRDMERQETREEEEK